MVDDSGARRFQPCAAGCTGIISLAPHLTETLFAAGAGERIVGTVEYSEHFAGGEQDRARRRLFTVDLERGGVAGRN
ncbi:MAG: hypothetical protein IPL11_15160 [Candidatus Accumulibacter sp.]|nr:hypothetical protein [Accumulibacter sp.]